MVREEGDRRSKRGRRKREVHPVYMHKMNIKIINNNHDILITINNHFGH